MPPKGSSKAKHNKGKFIGQYMKNKKNLSVMKHTLTEQTREIDKLSHILDRNEKTKNSKITFLSDSAGAIKGSNSGKGKKRKKIPSSKELNVRTKIRRRDETMAACNSIHGGSNENIDPTIDGLLDTITAKCKSDKLACKILTSKPSVVNSLSKLCEKKFKTQYFKSRENQLRSLNVYYSNNVMGKRKYLSVRKANKTPQIPNFIPYKELAQVIQSIDIGTVSNIKPTLTYDLPEDEIGDGIFRDLVPFAQRLAKFYLTVNKTRVDKIKTFEQYTKKCPSSILFLMAIGGDEAPVTGTSFLISFLNVGRRIASSYENFLLFGANVKESGMVVRRFVLKLVSEIKVLEQRVFQIDVNEQSISVEFKLELLPNDMKMLAFLAGELSNSASYFTTFANVNQHDANDITKRFSLKNDQYWKPFSYDKRIQDAKLVKQKKLLLQKRNSTLITQRTNLTKYIASELKSRQEEVPLFEHYIDLSKCEPLHMKNNVVKELFMKILKIVLVQSTFPSNLKSFSDLSDDNLLCIFISFIKKNMNCNLLSKKLIAWFNENKVAKKEREFGFRFRGKESFHYLKSFPHLISMLLEKVDKRSCQCFIQVFYESLNLRKLVSFSVRIEDLDENIIEAMNQAGLNLFLSCALFDTRISPSLWCFALVAPKHAEELFRSTGFGLGVNTMEGREQKHQQISKYSHNTTVQERWSYIFRHEFIQLIYLRENGFDSINYRKRNTKYIPDLKENHCSCSLEFIDDKCKLCDSEEFKKVQSEIIKISCKK